MSQRGEMRCRQITHVRSRRAAICSASPCLPPSRGLARCDPALAPAKYVVDQHVLIVSGRRGLLPRPTLHDLERSDARTAARPLAPMSAECSLSDFCECSLRDFSVSDFSLRDF